MYVCMYVCMYICTYVMLCYVMLCYVMLCYVMLCYVMLCYAMLHTQLERQFGELAAIPSAQFEASTVVLAMTVGIDWHTTVPSIREM